MHESNAGGSSGPAVELKWDSKFDAEAAHDQGWFFTNGGFFMRSVIDNHRWTPQFKTNKEALAFVKANAALGDPLCQKALAMMVLKKLKS